MELIWFVVFAVLLAGYFALEGFDLGVGLLMLGRPQERRDRMVAAVAPYVLANEVWLVAVAGALFGVYPMLEGPVLFGLYPVVVAMLLSWVLRDAGLWFRRRMDGSGWRSFWDLMITLGSLGLSVGWGVALYAAATGFTASLLHPFGLGLGALLAVLFAVHGQAFLNWREGGKAARLLLTGLASAAPVIALLIGSASFLMASSAADSSLSVLSFMVLPFAPIMVGAQVWVWRTFRGAIRTPSFF
ncbi:cytochrome d ubiquinol oxidase subunit II [Nonomuraea endophytica]|uniref:Cytochrome bd-type quinol oxidase subunit 2 n=1 Tax=Nonomuraea endophytica TaxID=714136 RepID=A0A7W8A155_9ACTN|nr:cytochrome d ubiquinol oxidase subunit II [Nonomuraea endophytica]MBB5077640.1 cytochrome bd-type quinol oxidase subunit 2 [Nonomuraea endophytica]